VPVQRTLDEYWASKLTPRQALSPKSHASDWSHDEVARVKEVVQGLQRRIFRAAREGQRKSLQNLLLRSRSAIYCAVEQVTEINSGKVTPGVDGLVYLTSEARAQLVQEISELNLRKYKPKPIKRVYIPKWDGRLRPLGLPAVKDRAVQWIAKAALEPEWEARFEYNSYGFRPGRGAHDAIAAIQRNLNAYGEQFVLEGDIEACFDNISHEFLLAQIKTPAVRRLVQSWLMAGVVDKGKLHKTTKGTPQGGVISPLLANIALHGMDQLLGAKSPVGEYLAPSRRAGAWQGVCLVRYADDFVVIADDVATLECDVKPALARFLGERGFHELAEVASRWGTRRF
jgi:RNA-directed DNA polymerase